MAKLREATRMAMERQVMMGLDVDQLMTLSMAPWQQHYKIAVFRKMYQDLGTFSRIGLETRAEVYQRLYEEALFAGALLAAPDPGEE